MAIPIDSFGTIQIASSKVMVFLKEVSWMQGVEGDETDGEGNVGDRLGGLEISSYSSIDG